MPNLTLKSSVEALAKRVDAMSEENLADLDRRLQNVIKAIDEAKKKKAAATEVYLQVSAQSSCLSPPSWLCSWVLQFAAARRRRHTKLTPNLCSVPCACRPPS